MSIVSSASLQVCWKGELLDAFSPSQGLCQGDSLSPYLFVLCMKTLHFKINWVILWKEWCPLKLSREVDLYPTFFFCWWLFSFWKSFVLSSSTYGTCFGWVLPSLGTTYESHKFSIWFSKNMHFYLQGSICFSLGVPPTISLGSYLGVPIIHGHVKKSTYQ